MISYSIFYFNAKVLKSCQNGDVKLEADGTPYFFWGNWAPICGHWFWDNQDGARLFCQKLGYKTGTQQGRGLGETYDVDAIRLGRCTTSLTSCSICSDKGVGNGCAACAAGQPVKFTITCEGETKETAKMSCKENSMSL